MLRNVGFTEGFQGLVLTTIDYSKAVGHFCWEMLVLLRVLKAKY